MVESKKILAYHRKTMSILITLITLPGPPHQPAQ